MVYVESFNGQNWLLPPSIKDMIPEDHICFLVEGFVDAFDFSRFDMVYDGAGRPAYHPRIIMKILVQGMPYESVTPFFNYDRGEDLDELQRNPRAKKLYDIVVRELN